MADITKLKPFYSVLILAFVCSTLVAAAVVGLRPLQQKNSLLDQKKNILYAAGLYDENKSVEEMFQSITPKLVDLKSGKYISEETLTPDNYKQTEASMDPAQSRTLNSEEDIAKLRRLESISLVYLVEKNGKLNQIVLPVRGKGLWSTMFAYVAINADFNTISGVSFYQHGETPGLGGEIDNKGWQKGWVGKKIFGSSDETMITVVKGNATENSKNIQHEIDGISGATLTSNGVGDLLQFWFGNNGFKPYLDRMMKAHIQRQHS